MALLLGLNLGVLGIIRRDGISGRKRWKRIRAPVRACRIQVVSRDAAWGHGRDLVDLAGRCTVRRN
jgi:hypothetical protein